MKMYVTFGHDHNHTVLGKRFNANTVAVLDCDDRSMGRSLVHGYFGAKWCWEYIDDEFDMTNLEKYNWTLREVKRGENEQTT